MPTDSQATVSDALQSRVLPLALLSSEEFGLVGLLSLAQAAEHDSTMKSFDALRAILSTVLASNGPDVSPFLTAVQACELWKHLKDSGLMHIDSGPLSIIDERPEYLSSIAGRISDAFGIMIYKHFAAELERQSWFKDMMASSRKKKIAWPSEVEPKEIEKLQNDLTAFIDLVEESTDVQKHVVGLRVPYPCLKHMHDIALISEQRMKIVSMGGKKKSPPKDIKVAEARATKISDFHQTLDALRGNCCEEMKTVVEQGMCECVDLVTSICLSAQDHYKKLIGAVWPCASATELNTEALWQESEIDSPKFLAIAGCGKARELKEVWSKVVDDGEAIRRIHELSSWSETFQKLLDELDAAPTHAEAVAHHQLMRNKVAELVALHASLRKYPKKEEAATGKAKALKMIKEIGGELPAPLTLLLSA